MNGSKIVKQWETDWGVKNLAVIQEETEGKWLNREKSEMALDETRKVDRVTLGGTS